MNIAIYSKSLYLSGAAKSLIKMLQTLDYSKVSIDLFIEYTDSPLLSEIPDEVNVIKAPRYRDFATCFKYGKVTFSSCLNFIRYRNCLLESKPGTFQHHFYTSKRMPKLRKKYDLAISYRNLDLDAFYILNNITADRKICWIHGETNPKNMEYEEYLELYSKYDYMIPVSKTAEKSFLKAYPSFMNKTVVIRNIIDQNEIVEKSNLFFPLEWENDETYKILTVGRLSPEKNIQLIMKTAKILKTKNEKFKWYIIGDGPERNKLISLIDNLRLDNFVVLLGEKNNPYPYIKNCDIYVQTSLTESYCLTIAEARILNKPIISTDIEAAREQLVPNQTGLIVSNDPEALTDAIMRLKYNTCLKNRLVSNLKTIVNKSINDLDLLYKLIP